MAKSGKKRDHQLAEGQGGQTASKGRPAVWVRILISIAVLWHVFVVFISPLAVQPASILVAGIATSPYVRWYTDSLYLNQGYHFFGPDPPRNHLVRYSVTDQQGAVVAEGSFPDKAAQRPRLFYHRHMMLADQAGNGPPDIPADDWLRFSLRAYARQLLRTYDGERAAIECVVHNPLTPRMSLQGVDPNTPETFETVMVVEESAAALAEPLPIPAPPAPETTAESLPAGNDL
ncbi:hypothetical protein Pla108_20670 [Botrimarina colliarenosi]|uniref:Uncharacterized protein n=1 Tax=Botrimarina colliarenosi TaxID=2528001 RepID=A0A5C6AI49_9BACT|nr:hypothetical protein [Botrimarina colliarenosi]TWT97913.1 hypothetical protein Pla108_20670 [Botrimarina colliarenosi]